MACDFVAVLTLMLFTNAGPTWHQPISDFSNVDLLHIRQAVKSVSVGTLEEILFIPHATLTQLAGMQGKMGSLCHQSMTLLQISSMRGRLGKGHTGHTFIGSLRMRGMRWTI